MKAFLQFGLVSVRRGSLCSPGRGVAAAEAPLIRAETSIHKTCNTGSLITCFFNIMFALICLAAFIALKI